MMTKPVSELLIIFLPFSWDSLSAAPANMVNPPMTSMPKRMRPASCRTVGRKLLTILPREFPVFNPMVSLRAL